MYQGHRIGAILLMAGEGIRFGGNLPKQFHPLGETPIYRYALETFLESGFFDEIILVCHPAWIEKMRTENPKARVVAGGVSRQESSYAGLCAFSLSPSIVLIHDAVRPFVTEKILSDNLEAAIVYGAADTCISSADTLVFAPDRTAIASIPNRGDFLRGQTPQTFRYNWILEAHSRAKKQAVANASDDCRLVLDMGYPVAVVAGCEENFKITSEFDLKIAEAVLRNRARDSNLLSMNR